MIEVRPEPSTWWLICRNPFFNQIFVHLVIDHRAAEGNLEDAFTDKETAPERGCPEWQKSPGWFGIRFVWWKSCNLAAELWKADPRCVSVPGQLWVQMKKPNCCLLSNRKAGSSSLQAGLLSLSALIYSNMTEATLGLVITWVYNSFTEQLASHLEQPGCSN